MLRHVHVMALATIFFASCGENHREPARVEATGVDDAPFAGDGAGIFCPAAIDFGEVVAGLEATRTIDCGGLRIISADTGLPWFKPAIDGSRVTVTFAPKQWMKAHDRLRLTLDRDGTPIVRELLLEGQALGWEVYHFRTDCDPDHVGTFVADGLARIGLTDARFGVSPEALAESPWAKAGILADPFQLKSLAKTRSSPKAARCFSSQWNARIDSALVARHSASTFIHDAAVELGAFPSTPVLSPHDHLGDDAERIIDNLCSGVLGPCVERKGALPADLALALRPLLVAIENGVKARSELEASAKGPDAEYWHLNGGNLSLRGARIVPDARVADVREFLSNVQSRAGLNGAAAQIAYAVQHIDWEPFRQRRGVSFDLRTRAGWIRVRDGESQTFVEDDAPVVLFLDLGGDDIHEDAIASNRTAANSVSIANDLDGDDRYGYRHVKSHAENAALAPADADGREQRSHPFSLSRAFRQGAAQYGIAMLFDLASGKDRYESLRGSQGYAHLGVGVLFDEGGEDTYVAEALSQGSAQFGIALLIDAGEGSDRFRSFTQSQGHAFVGGVAVLANAYGDDVYACDHGDPKRGGFLLYPSGQRPTSSNNSMCQGSSSGYRSDSKRTWLSGGLGILRDTLGNDRYEGSVFAQGSAFWQGIGLLSDGSGADQYDAFWYVQGGAAHASVAILDDAREGDDVFNLVRGDVEMSLGAGHDFSLGAFFNAEGNDHYGVGHPSAGAGHCNGAGFFLDTVGDDAYALTKQTNVGFATLGVGCHGDKTQAFDTIGIFMDAGGRDAFTGDPSGTLGDESVWIGRGVQRQSERAIGVNGAGVPGF